MLGKFLSSQHRDRQVAFAWRGLYLPRESVGREPAGKLNGLRRIEEPEPPLAGLER